MEPNFKGSTFTKPGRSAPSFEMIPASVKCKAPQSTRLLRSCFAFDMANTHHTCMVDDDDLLKLYQRVEKNDIVDRLGRATPHVGQDCCLCSEVSLISRINQRKIDYTPLLFRIWRNIRGSARGSIQHTSPSQCYGIHAWVSRANVFDILMQILGGHWPLLRISWRVADGTCPLQYSLLWSASFVQFTILGVVLTCFYWKACPW